MSLIENILYSLSKGCLVYIEFHKLLALSGFTGECDKGLNLTIQQELRQCLQLGHRIVRLEGISEL